MTDPVRTSWRAVNLALIVLALVLVALVGWAGYQALKPDPARADAERISRQYRAISSAAQAETVAFLTIDYKDMDPLMQRVLTGATGGFKQQYDGARANLKSSATAAQAVSTGKVRSVGISEISGSTATVFVAADSQVMNKSTQGKAQPRYYRLQLAMVRQAGKWLVSDLKFVG